MAVYDHDIDASLSARRNFDPIQISMPARWDDGAKLFPLIYGGVWRYEGSEEVPISIEYNDRVRGKPAFAIRLRQSSKFDYIASDNGWGIADGNIRLDLHKESFPNLHFRKTVKVANTDNLRVTFYAVVGAFEYLLYSIPRIWLWITNGKQMCRCLMYYSSNGVPLKRKNLMISADEHPLNPHHALAVLGVAIALLRRKS
jgi:hypothetical protein